MSTDTPNPTPAPSQGVQPYTLPSGDMERLQAATDEATAKLEAYTSSCGQKIAAPLFARLHKANQASVPHGFKPYNKSMVDGFKNTNENVMTCEELQNAFWSGEPFYSFEVFKPDAKIDEQKLFEFIMTLRRDFNSGERELEIMALQCIRQIDYKIVERVCARFKHHDRFDSGYKSIKDLFQLIIDVRNAREGRGKRSEDPFMLGKPRPEEVTPVYYWRSWGWPEQVRLDPSSIWGTLRSMASTGEKQCVYSWGQDCYYKHALRLEFICELLPDEDQRTAARLYIREKCFTSNSKSQQHRFSMMIDYLCDKFIEAETMEDIDGDTYDDICENYDKPTPGEDTPKLTTFHRYGVDLEINLYGFLARSFEEMNLHHDEFKHIKFDIVNHLEKLCINFCSS